MCVRCGTGTIAWCTSPDRHGAQEGKEGMSDQDWRDMASVFRAGISALNAYDHQREHDVLRWMLESMADRADAVAGGNRS